jgi:hypothetical protein
VLFVRVYFLESVILIFGREAPILLDIYIRSQLDQPSLEGSLQPKVVQEQLIDLLLEKRNPGGTGLAWCHGSLALVRSRRLIGVIALRISDLFSLARTFLDEFEIDCHLVALGARAADTTPTPATTRIPLLASANFSCLECSLALRDHTMNV